MSLAKTSVLNGLAVSIKMLTMLCINKILAIYVGPAGYAAVGQLQNSIQMLSIISGTAINTGVTKYTAEYYDDPRAQRALWSSAGGVATLSSIVVAFLIVFFRSELAFLFGISEEYSAVYIWFASGLVFFVFNSLLLAMLNGKKLIVPYVTANILGNVLALVVVTALTFYWGLYGALVSLAIYQSISFFITLSICLRAEWFSFGLLVGKTDFQIVKKLFSFALMTCTSAIVVPLSYITIRNLISTEMSLEGAGVWEAIMRVSLAYLTFVSTMFSVYFIPKFSELRKKTEIVREVNITLAAVVAFVALSLPILYLFRAEVIALLFTDEFQGAAEYMGMQFIGDFFKAIAFIYAYFAIAKANIKYFVVGEILFSLIFVGSSYLLFPIYDLDAVVYSYALTYFGYLLFVFFGYKQYVSKLA